MKIIDLKTGEETKTAAAFHSEIPKNYPETNEKKLLNSMIDEVLESMAKFQRRGSNWRFEEILNLEVHFVEFVPLKGNSWIPLPEWIKRKKAVINMKNEDNECFKWCVTRALNPVERDSEIILQKLIKQSEELNWKGISFPMEVKKIDRFEKNNLFVSVNVFYFDKSVQPLRISEVDESFHHIDLLLIEEDGKKHYCLIKNMSRLLFSQVSKYEKSKVFCRRCLNHFPNNEKLEVHKEHCSRKECVKIIIPKIKIDKDGNVEIPKIIFKNWNRMEKLPFVVYADFEAFLENIDSCEPENRRSFTEKYQKHKPCGFSYKIVCSGDISKFLPKSLLKPVLYRAKNADEDVAQIFVDQLDKDIYDIYQIFEKSKKMIYTRKDKDKFLKSEECWICKKVFSKNDKNVRDHCHFTGKFRGAAHNDCNLKVKKPKFTPVFFHNLSGYDSHLFVKNLGKSEGDIDCIPNNEEKYTSFSKKIQVGIYLDKDKNEKPKMHEIRFSDSAKFMASSLDSLVKNLGKEKLYNVRREFGEKTPLISRKGVYPYDYMDSLLKFSEEKLLPKETFFNRLNETHISDEDYDHAQNVWEKFGLKNMGEYHDLYLKSDVLLLADVFEEFRSVCLENYQLDPAWYYTSPGLAWDAALKKTGIRLELLTDPDMLLMFEEGIRGGVSMITKRYGKANNPYMDEDFDKKFSNKISYLS